MGKLHTPRPKTSDRTSFQPSIRPFAPPSAVRRSIVPSSVRSSVDGHREPAAGLIQRAVYGTMKEMLVNEFPGFADTLAQPSDDILLHWAEAQSVLPYVDFMNVPNADPKVDPNVRRADGRRTVKFDRTNPKNWDPHFFLAAIIHELIHVASALKYQKHLRPGGPRGNDYLNLHLPQPVGAVGLEGLTHNQSASLGRQVAILNANWGDLMSICDEDYNNMDADDASKAHMKHVKERVVYGGGASLKETDTVLFDLNFYMVQKDLEYTATFKFARRMLHEAYDRRNTPGTLARRVDKEAYLFQFWKW